MKLKEIKWREIINKRNTRANRWEGKIGFRIVGKIFCTGKTYEWIARLAVNDELRRGNAPSVEMAKFEIVQTLEDGIINKFFQKESV
jgi:hypothetical protein